MIFLIEMNSLSYELNSNNVNILGDSELRLMTAPSSGKLNLLLCLSLSSKKDSEMIYDVDSRSRTCFFGKATGTKKRRREKDIY